ncbi:Trypsin-like peptidase domain-containing protein [Streptosporangium canum]|uniref:Trypsin-like peptidase domain-containing protein n=1 Tax=Streptosporangium canum TaxID=324952 RepID=A0A1I3PCT4_9ACTN|nr:zinc ribbon domain-containing protein [Streptosporangium canum]SFJ19444.1 Trypsin-like peptidase domain-containing protein [Streptosporangium canum]
MRRSGSALTLLGGLALAVAAMTPALAHEHPSGITDLVTPAVVRVEAKARVDITLLDHIGELVHVERSYEVPIGAGTGTVVTPDGAVVTLARVVRTDKDIAVYAANKIFAEHHKVKIPQDFERHTIKNDQLNHHLQECYPPKQPTATCIVDITTEIHVFPNISPPDKEGFKAEIVRADSRPDGPAVLMPVGRADGGAGLPTAPLAATVPDKEGSPVAVAGFTGRPAADLPETVDIAHLRAGGAGTGGRQFKDPENKVDEPAKLGALVDKGLIGGPVIEDKKGAVVGLLVGGGKDGRMIGVREISKALAEAKVAPRRGPIDAAFEQALTRFHTKYYGDAVPAFQRVLDLYPGHTVAAAHLKTAQQKRGTAEDEGVRKAAAPVGDESDGPPLWPFLAAGGVLVVAVVAGALLLWRRRSPPGEGPAGNGHPGTTRSGDTRPGTAPVPIAGPPPALRRPPPDETADPTVVVSRSFPALPKTSSTSPGQPVLVARDPGAKPADPAAQRLPGAKTADTAAQKYCTACGMRLGPAHRFCGYCGHASET